MSEFVIYKNKDNNVQIDVRFEGETFWLSLNEMATLFGRDKSVVSRHLKAIFASGELDINSTVAKNATVQGEGGRKVTRFIEYYNLDAIISVGYRVNSKRGTQFRQWATQRLKEHLVQGYTINQKRLDELRQTVQLITQKAESTLDIQETKGLLHIIDFWRLLFVPQYRRTSGAPSLFYH